MTFAAPAPVSAQPAAPSTGNDEDAATLRAVDELMSDAVTRADPIRFDVARTEAERDAVFRLRYRVAIEHGWANPADFPDGRERDAYDAEAIHIVGWDGATLAATSRLVLPNPNRPLPTELAFGLIVEPRGRMLNIDRLTVAPGYSDRRHRTMFALLGASWGQTRAHDCHAWVGISTTAMVRLFRLLGFETPALAPPQRFWNEERVPIFCDGRNGATEALNRRSRLLAGPQRNGEATGRGERLKV